MLDTRVNIEARRIPERLSSWWPVLINVMNGQWSVIIILRLKDPQQQCKISWNIPKTWYKIVGHYEDGLYESLRDEVVFPFCGHLWNNCPIQERKYSNDIMSNLNSKLINWQLKIISMRNELILYLMNFLNKLLTNLWMWLRKWNYWCTYNIARIGTFFIFIRVYFFESILIFI